MKLITLHNVSSTRSCIWDIQENNIKKWQSNTELAKIFYQIHKINDNFNVSILQNNIKIAAARTYHEDKRICKLKNLAQHGLNTEIGDYFKVIIFYFLLIQ